MLRSWGQATSCEMAEQREERNACLSVDLPTLYLSSPNSLLHEIVNVILLKPLLVGFSGFCSKYQLFAVTDANHHFTVFFSQGQTALGPLNSCHMILCDLQGS